MNRKTMMSGKTSSSLALLTVVLAALLLSGCWDRIEVNDIAIVMATGIDKEKNGYRVSVMIPLPGNMGGASGGGGGSGGSQPYTIDSEWGRTVREAVERLQARLSRRLFFAHRKVLLIGEELARDGLLDILDMTTRSGGNRLTSYIAVTRGKASDVLSAAPKLERFSAEALRELLKSEAATGLQVLEVAAQLSIIGQDIVMPYVEKVKSEGSIEPSEEVGLAGFAYLKDGHLLGIATPSEMKGIRWLTNRIGIYDEMVLLNGKFVSVRIRDGYTAIRPVVSGNSIRMEAKLEGIATVQEAMNGLDYARMEHVSELKKRVEGSIKQHVMAAFELARSKRVDVVGFGARLGRTFPNRWRKEWSDDWDFWLGQLELDVQVSIEIDRAGLYSENVGKKERFK